jgi:putative hydrolase of the HAD superfamily
MVRGILIDLDDTLADDRFATDHAVLSFWKSHNEGSAEEDSVVTARWSEISEKHWRRFRSGQTTLQGQRRARISELFAQDFSESRADSLFDEFLSHYERSWRLAPGAHHFLQATAHLPKVIVTNCDAHQAARKVERLNLGGHFLAVVTPELAGVPKPKLGIFEHALKALGLPADGCLMIGDSEEYDIQPARALGMATFLVGGASGRGLAEAASAA